MKNLILTFSLTLLSVSVAFSKTAATAKADIANSQGEHVGTATFKETAQGVRLALEVANLPPGVHGFHIHAVGKCEAPDFKSAGGHFNPAGTQHGLENPAGHHAGDLQNLIVNAQGKAKVTILVPGVTLGEGANSLFQPQGTAIVIHANPDDMKTDPAGNAGARIACGVITK